MAVEGECEPVPIPVTIAQQQQQQHLQAVTTTISGSTFLTPASMTVANSKRRSSMPTENLFILGRGSGNGTGNSNGGGGGSGGGKSQRNRKKLLRRRSSGGAEIFSPILTEESLSSVDQNVDPMQSSSSSAWYRFNNRNSQPSERDALLSRRRGSLPIEVLSVGHSGKKIRF